MSENDNQGVAIVFNGNITPGTYELGDSKANNPQVIGLKAFNMA